MADDKDMQEKTEEPSQYRIDEFRKRGEVASSKEVNSILVLAFTLLTLVLSTVFIYESFEIYLEWLFSVDLESVFTGEGIAIVIKKSLALIIKSIGPVIGVAFFVGALSQIIQVGFIYAPEVLTLKVERINPLNGFKRLFSTKSLVEAIKGFAKFIVILSIATYFLKDDMQQFSGFLQHEFLVSFAYGKSIILKIAFSTIVGMFLIALGDLAWEKYSYRKKLMMSRQELKEENKEKDGNPEVKQRIRSIQREMANKRMMAEIPNADVIITNPTHLSIALKYDQKNMVSPRVIAKGADFLALRIRKIAKENEIPLFENIPLARSLYKQVEAGDTIPRELYKAVAEVLAFVYKRKKTNNAISLS